MSVQSIRCRIVICDGCGLRLGEDADYVIHFSRDGSEDDQMAGYIADFEWGVSPAGR